MFTPPQGVHGLQLDKAGIGFRFMSAAEVMSETRETEAGHSGREAAGWSRGRLLHHLRRAAVPRQAGGHHRRWEFRPRRGLRNEQHRQLGDVTAGHDKQIVIAAGEGAKAALGAFEFLIKQV